LTRYDRSTFYGGDGRGYSDYPTHADMAPAAVEFSMQAVVRQRMAHHVSARSLRARQM
jgi:hypothetical protein